jgi:hypothetical protein
MIFNSSRRYSTKAADTHLTGMIFIKSRQYLTKADNTHLMGTIFIRWKRYSFKRDEYHLWWLVLEITINHWRWLSTTRDYNQPLGMIIGRHRWYIVCSRWIYHLPQMILSKNSSRSQLSAKEDFNHSFLQLSTKKPFFFNLLHQIWSLFIIFDLKS